MDVCQRCHDAAHGNPWLVGELAHQAAAHGAGALSFATGSETPVRALAQDVIARRLAALSPDDRAVSAALAVLGERAQPHVVAAVAGIPARWSRCGAGRPRVGRLARPRCPRARTRADRGGDPGEPSAGRVRAATSGGRAHVALGRGAERHRCRASAPVPAAWRPVASAALQTRRSTPVDAVRLTPQRCISNAPWRSERSATIGVSCWPRSRWRRSTRACRGARSPPRGAAEVDDHASRVSSDPPRHVDVLDAGDDELAALLAREVAADHGPDTRLALEVAALEMLIMVPDRHAERACPPGRADRRSTAPTRSWNGP